ncbi:poly(rC)-binding protein 2-like [Babylonia areolata]|uniref:poly(rC)-binding protein 2-like n=1 Tax=Babylonia areolata TaxID=304850 RepID=UPI003FD65F2B
MATVLGELSKVAAPNAATSTSTSTNHHHHHHHHLNNSHHLSNHHHHHHHHLNNHHHLTAATTTTTTAAGMMHHSEVLANNGNNSGSGSSTPGVGGGGGGCTSPTTAVSPAALAAMNNVNSSSSSSVVNNNNNNNNGSTVGGGVGGSGGLPSVLTIRMIMQGKEVGSIIGKKGDNIKKFREDSGAKINISDGSCPERIVTVTGSIDTIFKAFTMISKKFEEDLANVPTTPKPPVTLRLVMPASQCGSLIGKQGCKIKEIRECTGASIQVASEMLPNSTERAVTVSGTADAITQCIKYICGIMQESPPKGANLPYRPKPVVSPVFVSGGPPFSVQPQMTLANQDPMKTLPPHMTMAPHPVPIIPTAQTVLPGGYVPVNGMTHIQYPRHSNPTQVPPLPAGQATHEMAIPNDLIGCIIGRGGQKINEIRQVSGANIKISNAEDGSADRKVTITGTPETIGLAQYLISTSMELHKALTLVDPTSVTPTPVTSTSLTPVHPPLTVKPATAAAPITYISGYGPLGLVDPMGASSAAAAAAAAAAASGGLAVGDRKALTTKLRVAVTAGPLKAAERPKFAPQTTHHLLQSCPFHEALRRWSVLARPNSSDPEALRLYGGPAAYTAVFIAQTGLSI